MKRDFKIEIAAHLNEHRLMTIATNRSDGWPQATVVSYANEGLVLYCILGRNSQKYRNIVRDPRVSVTINSDYGQSQRLCYKGLSLAGRATISEQQTQIDRVREIILSRHPQYEEMLPPDPAMIGVLRLTPEIVSIIDYSKGFGHSDLVRVNQEVELVESSRHHWAGLQAV
jgi:nitroimidazol reductase NimA-like FMN-containing flavoprotein (pyridoxamine 5'-phosphate oxidase superfamily)